MQEVIERNNAIDVSYVHNMRHMGATLSQIADKICKTKERVRQILVKNYGTTKHKLISTRQLCRLSGLSRNRILKLYKGNVITPVTTRHTNTGNHFLWSIDAVEKAKAGHKPVQSCRLCHRPIPTNRECFCSEQCYKENHKYKYMDIETKQKHMLSIKRYREKRKKLALTTF